MGGLGWGGRRKGYIKNQSNRNGAWRRRTPCETVNHVPLLNMGQFSLLCVVFGVSLHFVLNVIAGTVCLCYLRLPVVQKVLYNQLLLDQVNVSPLLISTPFFSMTLPCCSLAPCFVALWLKPVPLYAFCPPSHAQQTTDATATTHTPTVGERHSLLSQPIKSPQDHSGPLEVNSWSSLWWSRHSSPLLPRASLNLTTSPQPELYCSASLMLNCN